MYSNLSIPSKSLSVQGKLIDTTIVSKKTLVGFSWLDSTFNKCKFVGNFKENEFGSLEDSVISLESCDFTDAILDDCLFYGRGVDNNQYASLPQITILDPHLNYYKLKKEAPEDESILDIVESIEFLDKKVSAISMNLEIFSKEVDGNLELLKDFFSQFPFIIR